MNLIDIDICQIICALTLINASRHVCKQISLYSKFIIFTLNHNCIWQNDNIILMSIRICFDIINRQTIHQFFELILHNYSSIFRDRQLHCQFDSRSTQFDQSINWLSSINYRLIEQFQFIFNITIVVLTSKSISIDVFDIRHIQRDIQFDRKRVFLIRWDSSRQDVIIYLLIFSFLFSVLSKHLSFSFFCFVVIDRQIYRFSLLFRFFQRDSNLIKYDDFSYHWQYSNHCFSNQRLHRKIWRVIFYRRICKIDNS